MQFIGNLNMVLMFASPVSYPATALPEAYRELLYLNPLTPEIKQTPATLYWGNAPDFGMLGIYRGVTSFIGWLDFARFRKTRKGFADVL